MNEELKDLAVLPAVDGNTRAYGDNGTVDGALTINQIQSVISPNVGNFKIVGGWDASTNTPALASGVGTAWEAYYVTVPGNTILNGVGGWQPNEILVFNPDSNAWEKSGTLKYYAPYRIVGVWNASTNITTMFNGLPGSPLASGVGNWFEAYVVGTAGTTNLDGTSDWNEGDNAIFIPNPPSPGGFWVKGGVNRINNRGGIVTFPATQGEIMFGSADNWIDQDGNFFWDKARRNFKAGFNNTIAATATNSSITAGTLNQINDTSSNCSIKGGNGNIVSGTSSNSSINDGNSNLIQDSDNACIDSSGIGQITTASHFAKSTSSLGANIYNSPLCSVKNSSAGTITNSTFCGIENAVPTANINNSLLSRLSEIEACTVEGATRSLVTSGDNGTISGADGSLIGMNHKATYNNITYSFVAGGDTPIATGILNSAILPGNQNSFENLENCIAGGGFQNVAKNAAQSVFLANAAINVELVSGFSWNFVATSVNVTNSSPSFTAICSNGINGGDTSVSNTIYLHSAQVENTNNLSNIAVFGKDNVGAFVPQYSNQLNIFYNNGVSINRPNAGTGGLITTSLSTQNVSTDWPLFNYQMTQNDSIVRGKYAGGAGVNALDLYLPIETDLADGRECEYWNDSAILPAAHNVQSGTGKQIRVNGVVNMTPDINFIGCVFKFIWCKADNYWICQRLA